MHAKNYVRSSLAAALALMLVSSCNKSHQATPASPPTIPDDDLGISLSAMPLLATNCTITQNILNVTVKDGETAYVTLRPDDNQVTVNGTLAGSGGAGAGGAGGAPQCAVPSTGRISIKADSGGTSMVGRSVLIDHINGTFMKSASAALTGIKIDFTLTGDNGSKNALRIRGSQGNDAYVFGAGSAVGAAMNLNAPNTILGGGAGAGGAGTTDLYPDIVFKNVTQVVIAAGPGNDRVDASGRMGAGVGAAYPHAVSLFGNDDDDEIVGGLGDDMIVGGLGADILKGCQGNDTYDMGIGPSGADIIQQNCSATNEGLDVLDYSKRTGDVTVTLSATLSAAMDPTMDMGGTSGETGEMARISDKLATIKMGAGNDTINVPAASTVAHTILGGDGNDSYTGMGVADVFDGENGDDTCISANSTMDYSSRMNAVNVTICSMGCMSTDANDGDQTATGSTNDGEGAATTAAGGIQITTLAMGAGFTTASVGNAITLSSCNTPANDGIYTIVRYLSATDVKLKIPMSVGSPATDTGCMFSEALPNGMTNTGAGATLSAPSMSASVTMLSSQIRGLGKTITLDGGMASTTENGTYAVLELLAGNTSVAIDAATPVMGGGSFAGGVGMLTWTLTGPESDNVQCAHVLGTAGDDTITGDQRVNVLRGGDGNDTLNGGAGNDNLYGEAGNDNLYGGAGDDTLIGSAGADVLVGGDGSDVLQGDADSDTFNCDGKNASTDTMDGTSPGDVDFRVDYTMGETLTTPHGCEF